MPADNKILTRAAVCYERPAALWNIVASGTSTHPIALHLLLYLLCTWNILRLAGICHKRPALNRNMQCPCTVQLKERFTFKVHLLKLWHALKPAMGDWLWLQTTLTYGIPDTRMPHTSKILTLHWNLSQATSGDSKCCHTRDSMHPTVTYQQNSDLCWKTAIDATSCEYEMMQCVSFHELCLHSHMLLNATVTPSSSLRQKCWGRLWCGDKSCACSECRKMRGRDVQHEFDSTLCSYAFIRNLTAKFVCP